MKNSKSGNAPFSSFSSGPRSFQSKNLNNTLKPASSSPFSRDPKPVNANNLKGGMAVLVGKKQVTKSIGAAATPVPVNTPSLRSEIKSKDPWGGSAPKGTPTESTSGAKPASWTKDTTDGSAPDAATSSSAPVGTTSSLDRGRNWAIRDDSDDDDDEPVQANNRAEDSTGNQYNNNRSSNYSEKDWGRENYHLGEDEGKEGEQSGDYRPQRPRGNSDVNRYQSRFNRDGYDDRRGGGYRDSRGDYGGYRERYDRPPPDRRFGYRDSRHYGDMNNNPPVLNSRARALSGDVVAGEEPERDRDRNQEGSGDRDPQWRRHNNYYPDGDGDRRHNRPQYNIDRDRDRGEDRDRDRDSYPRDRDRPKRDGFPQRDRAYSGSFTHSSNNNTSNLSYKAPDSGSGSSSGWQRVSISASNVSAAPTALSKERMKVNQVSTTLLRPNREIVLATSGFTGPAMKVLTKQTTNALPSAGTDGSSNSHLSGTGNNNINNNGNNNNTNVNATTDVAGDASTAPDAFGKTFASLLAAKESMDAAAATARTAQRKDSYPGDESVQDREDHEYEERNRDGYFHNTSSQDRRRRFDDEEGRDGNRGGYYNSGQYGDHNDDYGYYPGNNGRNGNRYGGGESGRGGGYPVSRHSGPPATVLPPRRKGGMLFEPKSGQFVENEVPLAAKEDSTNTAAVPDNQHVRTRKFSESSTHSAHDKKDVTNPTAPSTGAVAEEGGRWARVSMIKRGLASDSHASNPSAIDSKPALTSVPEIPPVLSKAQEEELKRAKYLEERKALRTQERLARGPRTKGKLYRFNSKGEIEEVLSVERVVEDNVSATHVDKEHGDDEITSKTETVEVATNANPMKSHEEIIAGPSDTANPVEETPQPPVTVPAVTDTTYTEVGGAHDAASSEDAIPASGGGKSPTTPRSSELVATASVYTPSQPLLASLQQQQFQQQQLPQLHAQQQPQQQQQQQAPLTPASLPYPGLIDANNLPVIPGASNTATAPGPPFFMSSPGMTNMLFGRSPGAAGAPYGMTNTGMMNMNSGMMNTMGNMGMNNMYYGMNMMPGMIMDNGSIYSVGGSNVGGLSWSNNTSMNSNTANTNSNTNPANTFMTSNSMFGSGGMWPVGGNPTTVSTEDASNSNNTNKDTFATPNTGTSSVGGTTAGAVNSNGNAAMVGTMRVLSPQMSNWGNPRTTTNNSNLYGVMMSNDMDTNNSNNTNSFYYGGGSTGMMNFFPNNANGNTANNTTMSAEAMMFGNMPQQQSQQQQQQMHGDFGYNANYQPPMTGSANSTTKGDMFGPALSNANAGAGVQSSPGLTGADGGNVNGNTMQSQSNYYSTNATNGNNGMMGGNFNTYNNNNNNRGSNMGGGVGGYGRNSGYRNNNNANANANKINSNAMNYNANSNSGGYGMNNNMYGGGSGGGFGGNYGNANNSNMNNMYGNNNNSNAENMYNAAPGGYTNRQQQGRGYNNYNNNNNNSNYYNNNAGYNNYQQQSQR